MRTRANGYAELAPVSATDHVNLHLFVPVSSASIDGFLGLFSVSSLVAQSDQPLLSFFFLSVFPLTENEKAVSFLPFGYLSDRFILTVFFVSVLVMSTALTVVALNCWPSPYLLDGIFHSHTKLLPFLVMVSPDGLLDFLFLLAIMPSSIL